MKTRTMIGKDIVFFKSYGTELRKNEDGMYVGYSILIPDEIPTEFNEDGLHILAERTSDSTVLAYKKDEGWKMIRNGTVIASLESGELVNEQWNQIYHPEAVVNRHSKLTDSNFSENQHAVADSLTQRLSVIKNELWYNYNYGLPLLDKGATKAMIDAKIVQIVKSHPDVTNIIDIESTIEDRRYHCNIEVQSVYGNLFVSI